MLMKFPFNFIKRPLFFLLLLLLLLSFNNFLLTIQIAFNYHDFMNKVVKVSIGDCPVEWKNICLYVDADESDGVVDLTRKNATSGLEWSKGIAVYSEPMQLWNKETKKASNFRTEFSFIIKSVHSELLSGNGLAFFISSFPYEEVGLSRGSGLGLVSIYNRFNEFQNNSFVAVELDTSHDFWDPTPSTHVGIDVNSIRSMVYKNLSAELRNTQGRVQVDYNSTTFNLSVSVICNDDATPTMLSYIVDLKDVLPENVSIGFTAATGAHTEINQILSWSFSSYDGAQQQSSNNDEKPKIRSTRRGLVIGLVLGIALSICSFVILWYFLKRKNQKLMEQQEPKLDAYEKDSCGDDVVDMNLDEELGDQNCPRRFHYQELVTATDNFNENRKLGEGGFGPVYKGFLKALNLNVAVKRVSSQSKQGRKEYIAEVKIISQLRHKNLLRLIGWCHQKNDFIIVYELMENGSLDSYIFNHKRSIPWPSRYKIMQGLASGLLYLHEEGEQCIVHRDVKSSNIMLDKAFDAKLGDFGLARLSEHGRGLQTTFLAGTMGYVAPECVITGKCSKESDVYSFGIVALEIACGRKCIDNNLDQGKNAKLVDWVWKMYGEGRLLETVDDRILPNTNSHEEKQIQHLLMVGLWCAHPDLNQRPSITQVIAVLNLEAPLPDLPPMMPVPSFITPPFTTISALIDGYSTSNQIESWSRSTSTNLR